MNKDTVDPVITTGKTSYIAAAAPVMAVGPPAGTTAPPRGRRWPRIAALTGSLAALVLMWVLLGGGAAQAAVLAQAPAPGGGGDTGINPFEGVTPNFEVFGMEFNAAWKKILGGIWAICFVVVAFGALRAVLDLQRAKKGGFGQSIAENTDSAKNSGIALGALTGIGVIFGAIVSIF